MTEAEFNLELAKGNVGFPQQAQAQQQAPAQQPNGDDLIYGYIAILEQLRSPHSFLASAPTFTPKTFLDQIQFYDDGTNRRIYFYVNKVWRYTSLT